jgi:hypothetical protein
VEGSEALGHRGQTITCSKETRLPAATIPSHVRSDESGIIDPEG